jgi:hypothetical protein
MLTRQSRAGLLCAILVCAGNSNSQQKPATARIQPETPGNALALSKAMEHFSAHWQQCGDSYVSIVPSDPKISNDFEVTEIKGVRPYLPSGVNRPLTEADRLNGFSWKGMVFFDYVAIRHFRKRQNTTLLPFRMDPSEVNRWGEWHPASWKQDHGLSQEGYWWLEVTEKNGQWQVKPSSLDAESSSAAGRRQLDCSKLSVLGQSSPNPPAAPEGLQQTGMAQDAKKVEEPEYINVMFALDSNMGLKALERQTPNAGMKVKALGYGGARSVMLFKGKNSPIRFSAEHKPEFVVRLGTREVDPATLIQFFALKVVQGNRELQIVKTGFMNMKGQATLGEAGVPFNVSKYGESSVKITPISLLAPGEYTLSTTSSKEGYLFGVDQK